MSAPRQEDDLTHYFNGVERTRVRAERAEAQVERLREALQTVAEELEPLADVHKSGTEYKDVERVAKGGLKFIAATLAAPSSERTGT